MTIVLVDTVLEKIQKFPSTTWCVDWCSIRWIESGVVGDELDWRWICWREIGLAVDFFGERVIQESSHQGESACCNYSAASEVRTTFSRRKNIES